MKEINEFSLTSFFLIPKLNGVALSEGATGFLYKHKKEIFLVTNRHVLTGKNNDTNVLLNKKTIDGPDTIDLHVHGYKIIQNEKIILKTSNTPDIITINLYENKQPQWIEHPIYGSRVDVVAIKIPYIDNLVCVNDFQFIDEMILDITSNVSIIGYPFSQKSSGHFPIWMNGVIASEPQLNARNNLPNLYIDCRGRPGMSGSPVIHKNNGTYHSSDGATNFSTGNTYKFIGIYSGRISTDSDIGIVWKKECIDALFQQQHYTINYTYEGYSHA
ncbi:MAG: trypsin-like peptidase domain-containing protein [bacterium]